VTRNWRILHDVKLHDLLLLLLLFFFFYFFVFFFPLAVWVSLPVLRLQELICPSAMCMICTSLYIIRVITSRRMRWVGHVASVRGNENSCRVLVSKPKDRDHLKDVGIDGR
jgi:hypothetical protein